MSQKPKRGPGRPPRKPEDYRRREMRARQRQFLALYRDPRRSMEDCALAMNLSPETPYAWKRDPVFVEKLEMCREERIQQIEEAAQKAATVGFARAIWHKGECVGHDYLISEKLLIKLLEAYKPEVFKQNKTEVVFERTPDQRSLPQQSTFNRPDDEVWKELEDDLVAISKRNAALMRAQAENN